MSVVVVGLNHRSANLAVLEPMTVRAAALPKVLHELGGKTHLTEVVVVSTCMRTEIYAVANRYHDGIAEIRGFLHDFSGLPPEVWSDLVYTFHDDAAARHLFRVASGIDSAVLGEGEVLRQVHAAWEAARAEGVDGPALATLFRLAVETGKRVRTETAIATGTTSLSHAAVAMAGARLGSLAGRTTLVIGAGEMGEAMAGALAGAPAAGPLLVANRTWERALELADRLGGEAVGWESLRSALDAADVVLTSTGSPDLLLEAGDLEGLVLARGGRPLLVVDIAVPRDVDPAVGRLPGVTLLDMDDLKRYAEGSMASRRGELPAAEAVVEAELRRYLEIEAQREVTPVVAALHARAEEIRAGELARASGRLGALDASSQRAVEALTRSIVAKLLHDPTVAVKSAAALGEGEQLARALRRLFDL